MKKILSKELLLPREEYYERHLGILNVLLPSKMTPKELQVLAAFMSLDSDNKNRFGPNSKKTVMKRLSVSPSGLSNYLQSLKKKGFVYHNEEGDLNILNIIVANSEEQLYQFKLIRNNE